MPSSRKKALPRTEAVDKQVQREVPARIKLSQSLPTASASSILDAPLISEKWQQFPETKVPDLSPSGSNCLWPIIIICSAIAAGLVNFVFTDIAVRPAVAFWFLIICPGMALVRFLRLKEPVLEWTLALALSVAIDALVASIQLYTGTWSPPDMLCILIGLSLCSAIVQLATRMVNRWRIKPR